MAETRYFQHLNENESDFQQVTTLDYIDNSDGFLMYYFKDGSKCNKSYIAPVNANSIDGYEFAEISDVHNKWHLMVSGITSGEKPKPAKGKDGNWYEAPDLSEKPSHNVKRVSVVSRPVYVSDYKIPNDSDYYFDTIQQPTFNFNENKNNVITPDFAEIEEPVIKERKVEQKPAPKQEIIEQPSEFSPLFKNNGDIVEIDVKALLDSNKTIRLYFPDGNSYESSAMEFIDNAITPKEEKVVEKVVEKEVLVKTSDTDIDLGIDSTQKGLLDNMIDMSNKMECSIDMELTLRLPPASVYKLIKSVYPEGMDRGFVNIIANRMQVKELKTSVADGLMAFYDEEYNSETPKQSEEDLNKDSKKPGRKKQTV